MFHRSNTRMMPTAAIISTMARKVVALSGSKWRADSKLK
jgi:hypothetical protein